MRHAYSEGYRWEKYYELPLVCRFFVRIPFMIYNWCMNEFEYYFGDTCPICNRSYCILTRKGREKLDNCCAQIKRNRSYGGTFSAYDGAERRYDGSEEYYYNGAHKYYRRD